MAFNAEADMLKFDPASGDHGLAFYGHSHITQGFVVRHPDFGWLCYFCDLATATATTASSAVTTVTITPRDTYRKKVYIAALGLQIISDAGTLHSVTTQLSSDGKTISSVTVAFNPKGKQPLTRFRLRLLTRAKGAGFKGYAPASGLKMTRGGWDIAPVSGSITSVVIKAL